MLLYEKEPLKLHPGKFGGQKHCGNRVIMVLICHVILQDHVIKDLCGVWL